MDNIDPTKADTQAFDSTAHAEGLIRDGKIAPKAEVPRPKITQIVGGSHSSLIALTDDGRLWEREYIPMTSPLDILGTRWRWKEIETPGGFYPIGSEHNK